MFTAFLGVKHNIDILCVGDWLTKIMFTRKSALHRRCTRRLLTTENGGRDPIIQQHLARTFQTIPELRPHHIMLYIYYQ
jgi:hypothetical protein